MVTFNAYSLTERVGIKVQKWEKKNKWDRWPLESGMDENK